MKKGFVVNILRVLTKRGGDDERTGGVSTVIRSRIFSAAPTKLQSNYRNVQQEIIFHHSAKRLITDKGNSDVSSRLFSTLLIALGMTILGRSLSDTDIAIKLLPQVSTS